jgi:putative FmdB family regulatory protein
MPTYEFRCPLGHEFERFYRSIGTAEAQTACPECGQMAERMMSAGAGLVFKGSGFYLTDYGKDAHKKKAPSETKGEGAKGEGAKGEGAKGEGAKGESSGSSGDGAASSSTSSESDSAKKDAKPAESKPAPKPSSGE